jgi:hypothetical protein
VSTTDLFGFEPELRCEAGQRQKPGRETCTRHPSHHWCRTCRGWYGVPHDNGMHDRDQGHDGRTWTRGCACRPCREHER